MEATVIGYNGIIFCNAFVGGVIGDNDQQEVRIENLSPALLNNPLDEGQLGFVLDLEKIVINPEAKELLKKIKPGRDAIGDIDLFKAGEKSVLAWLGGPMILFDPTKAEGSREFDISILENAKIEEVEIPKEIIEYFK